MLPLAHHNKITSKWKGKLGDRTKRKEDNFSMWQAVEEKWEARQAKTKVNRATSTRQEVEKISEVVNLMHQEERALVQLLEETNSLDYSIDTIIERASNNGDNTAAEESRIKQ